MKTPEAELMGV